MKKNKIGRPLKFEEKKTKHFSIRLSEKNFNLINAEAENKKTHKSKIIEEALNFFFNFKK